MELNCPYIELAVAAALASRLSTSVFFNASVYGSKDESDITGTFGRPPPGASASRCVVQTPGTQQPVPGRASISIAQVNGLEKTVFRHAAIGVGFEFALPANFQ